MRARLTELGVAVPALADGDGHDGAAGLRRRGRAGRSSLKTPRGGYDGKGVRVVGTRRRKLPTGSRTGRGRCWPRSASTSPASWPCSSRAARTARPRSIRSSRRCRSTASAARCSHRPPIAGGPRAGRPAGRAAHRRGPRRHRRARRRDVRHGRRRARQRAGDAPAQQRSLDDRGGAHQPVRAAPARGARPAARRHPDDRAARRHGQRPRRRHRRDVQRLPALHGPRPGRAHPHVRKGRPPRAKGGSRHDGWRPC